MTRPPVPPALIVMDVAGVLLAGVGTAGLISDLSMLHPALANREVAGMVAAVGFGLMTFALLKIIQHLRANHTLPPPQDEEPRQ